MQSRILLSILLLLALVPSPPASSQSADAEEPPKLLGRCTASQLEAEPFAEWYRSGYEDYTPNSEFLEELRTVGTAGIDITVFFGTWCGDSRREVPRIVKLLDEMGFPEENLALVAVDGVDEALKQSPGGEERGREIYRVPTVIVERGGREISRLVEHPVLSLERDLLAILSGNEYEPNYASYPVVRRWLADGLLADPNVSPRGLANEVRHIVSTEGELSAAGLVLLTRGDVDEAVKLCQVNCVLHRQSSRCAARLADALLAAGEPEQARAAAERALRLNDDPERIKALLELIERVPENPERADD